MLSLFRRKTPVDTFNTRVASFWKAFTKVAPRFYQTIESGKCADLAAETSELVHQLGPGFAWVYGPGPNKSGHSLTVSGEGVEARQFLALQWLALAPEIPGWTFYASRQSGPIKGHVIQIDGLSFDPKEIWVTPAVDLENERIDLHVWHHSWKQLTENRRWTITFLFLDEALGEYGTQWWIGEIFFDENRLADSIPLEELAEFVTSTSRECGWKKYPPGESWTLFSLEPKERAFRRGDLITLSTAAPALFRDYFDAEGELEDPLEGNAADFVFISIPSSFFPSGDEANKRGEVEDPLDTALRAAQSGHCIGGGFGFERGYVDLLLFDGERSLTIVQDVLRKLGLPPGCMIEYFAKEKRKQRLPVK